VPASAPLYAGTRRETPETLLRSPFLLQRCCLDSPETQALSRRNCTNDLNSSGFQVVDLKAVRAWAASEDIELSSRGRVRASVLEFPNARLGSDATCLDTTMLVGNAPSASIKICSIAQD
jgi:hypothetical protein